MQSSIPNTSFFLNIERSEVSEPLYHAACMVDLDCDNPKIIANLPLFLCIFTVYSSTSDLVLVLISIRSSKVWTKFMSNKIVSVKCNWMSLYNTILIKNPFWILHEVKVWRISDLECYSFRSKVTLIINFTLYWSWSRCQKRKIEFLAYITTR